jgi:hypothetical protein
VTAHIELAKFYEWHESDFAAAIQWTEQAISLSQSWQKNHVFLLHDELEHRLNRLKRKFDARVDNLIDDLVPMCHCVFLVLDI